MISAKEMVKLLSAGFTCIEAKQYSNSGLSIWQKTPEKREWHLREKGFATKAALKRRMDELLKDKLIVDILGSYFNL